MLIAEAIVYTVMIYLGLGFVFSVYFSFFRVKSFDDSASNAGIFFGLIILAGVAAFWPMFVLRLVRGVKQPVEKTMHRKLSEERK